LVSLIRQASQNPQKDKAHAGVQETMAGEQTSPRQNQTPAPCGTGIKLVLTPEPAALENVDDVAFTSDMIDRISAEYCVDPSRIYATGMSNGAFMSYRLTCELAGRIAAIGPVAGVTVVDPSLFSRPVPVIPFNGTADLLVWYDGGI
jgi:poly(3-hydroxybutyrate) depolymerase